MYTVYVIKQNDKVYYVGKTINFKRRVYEHRYRRNLDKTYLFVALEDNLSKEDAKIKEEFYIEKYNTIEKGWNRTAGEGSRKVKNAQGDGRFSKGNEEFKKRKIKKVICVETGKIYDSVRECAKDMGVYESGIYQVCNGANKTYNKMHFEYIDMLIPR